jgi:hypothetical protein
MVKVLMLHLYKFIRDNIHQDSNVMAIKKPSMESMLVDIKMVYDQAMEHLNGITVKPTKATGKAV